MSEPTGGRPQMKRINYQDAASYLGIKVATLRSMVSRRQVPHIRLGPQLVRFDIDELEKWLREHSVAANESR